MKKIFTFLFLFFVTVIFLSNNVSAQTNDGVVVSTVSISNTKIVSQNNRDFVISFDISNKTGIQPNVRYAIQLAKIPTAKQSIQEQLDEKIYDEALTLGTNAFISKTINYSIPFSIAAGSYRLFLESKNENGLLLSIAFIGDIKITGGVVSGGIEIFPESCYFTLGTSTDATKYAMKEGISILSTDNFILNCKIESDFSSNTILKPNFVTRSHSLFGNIVSTNGGTTEAVILKKGVNNISLYLPKASKPQDYNLSFSLVSDSLRSNTVSFTYVLVGVSGTIQNVIFDKDFYNAGDTANLQIYSTQNSSTTSTISARISDNTGYCSSVITKQTNNFSVINLQIPINKNCINPKANISISSNGEIIASSDIQVNTPEGTIIPENSNNTNSNFINIKNIVLVVLFIIVMLILGIIFYKKKHPVIKVFIFLFVISSLFLGLSRVSYALCGDLRTWCWANAEIHGYNVDTSDTTATGPSSSCYEITKERCNNGCYNTGDYNSGTLRGQCYSDCNVYYGDWTPAVCPPSGIQTKIADLLPPNCVMHDGTPTSNITRYCTYIPLPNTPIGLTTSCNADGSKMTFSWDAVAGAVRYAPRVNDWQNAWRDAWPCAPFPGDICREQTETSVTVDSYFGKAWNWWVHAINSSGSYGPQADGGNVWCTQCNYTYSDWGECTSYEFFGTQWHHYRAVLTKSPTGCGGTPTTVEACVPPAPEPSIYTNINPVPNNGSATIGWYVNNYSTGCVLSSDKYGTYSYPATTRNSSITFTNMTQSGTFTLTCIGSGGRSVSTSPLLVNVLPCVPATPLTQTISCPAGQTGSITQTRTSVCPGPVTSAWTTTSNTCITPCTSWTYSNWGACIGNQKTRTALTYSPAGCVGEPPAANLTQTCTNPALSTTCIGTQAGSPPGNIFVNKNMTWTVNLGIAGVTNVQTKWWGTNIGSVASPINISGNSIDKIYTTVGRKDIDVLISGYYPDGVTTFSDIPCSSSTVVEVDEGSGGEL